MNKPLVCQQICEIIQHKHVQTFQYRRLKAVSSRKHMQNSRDMAQDLFDGEC